MNRIFSPGQAAEQSGFSLDTLRYYERIGLLDNIERTPDIACDLGEEKAATQAERWLRLGREAGLGRAETADGLEIRFRDEAVVERELRDLVSVESKCCAWARWEVRRGNGELVMRVSSTPEGAAALHAMFGTAGNADR